MCPCRICAPAVGSSPTYRLPPPSSDRPVTFWNAVPASLPVASTSSTPVAMCRRRIVLLLAGVSATYSVLVAGSAASAVGDVAELAVGSATQAPAQAPTLGTTVTAPPSARYRSPPTSAIALSPRPSLVLATVVAVCDAPPGLVTLMMLPFLMNPTYSVLPSAVSAVAVARLPVRPLTPPAIRTGLPTLFVVGLNVSRHTPWLLDELSGT